MLSEYKIVVMKNKAIRETNQISFIKNQLLTAYTKYIPTKKESSARIFHFSKCNQISKIYLLLQFDDFKFGL